MKSGRIRAYVSAVVVAAFGAVALLPGTGLADSPGVLLVLAGLAALAGALPVRISSQRVELTTTHPPLLCALAALGAYPAIAVALAGVIGSTVGRRRRSAPIRLVFNLAAVVLSTAAASWCFLALGGVPGAATVSLLGPLLAATTVYFLVNTGLVGVAIVLEKRRAFLRVWKTTFPSIVVTYAAGLTLTACMLLLLDSLGAWGVALAVPPVWLLIAFYRTHQQRFEEKERRITEVERLNTELEATVADLREALVHVNQLQGLIPICMHCKDIRDGHDTWHKLEQYIASHSEATFTHALCETCLREHYPDAARKRG